MQIKQIENPQYHIYQLKVRFLTMINYTYLVIDQATGEAMLVDPSWEFGELAGLLESLALAPTKILLTHSHYDHVNAVGPLLKQYNPQVYLGAPEIAYYHFQCRNLNPVEDREQLWIGNTAVTCMLTPGHTAGGFCYLLSDSLFTGDTVFIEGCGFCETEGGNPEQMYDSIQKIKTQVSPKVRIYPAHSYGKPPGCTLGELVAENIYFQIISKQHFVEFRMRKNQRNLFSFK